MFQCKPLRVGVVIVAIVVAWPPQVFDEHREDIAELLYKRSPDTEEKLASRVCTKWAKVCPAKAVPASFERKDEFWMPMDEVSGGRF